MSSVRYQVLVPGAVMVVVAVRGWVEEQDPWAGSFLPCP